MLIISIICGLTGVYFTYQFYSYSRIQFLKLRHPTLILVYCCCSSIQLLALCPIYIYAVIISHLDDIFWLWFLHFLHEFAFTCMVILIAARCWLLYYDHCYGVSLVDKNWRGVIANENNFWLKHRKTWGDFGFIVCVSIVVSVIALVGLCSISIYSLQYNNLAPLHLFSFLAVTVPCSVLIYFLIHSNKSKKLFLYDEFVVFHEMQYLSNIILVILVVNIIEMFQFHHTLVLMYHGGQIFFCAMSNYIQTKWVMKQLIARNRALLTREKTLIGSRHNRVKGITMSDILKDKDGFTMFMRHCQNEMNVEGLLFIIEVAQYKAKVHGIIHNNERIGSDDNNAVRISVTGGYHVTESVQKPLPPLSKLLGQTSTETVETHEHGLAQFESHILERDWIPISNQLYKPKTQNLLQVSAELQIVCTEEKTQNEVQCEQERNEMMLWIDRDTKVYEYAQVLFLKYIDVESDFTINVSYGVRKQMLLFFSKTKEKGFDYILGQTDNDTIDEMMRSLSIKQYLYGVFDAALSEIWNLLSSDTYLRFRQTKQYQYLIKNKNRRASIRSQIR